MDSTGFGLCFMLAWSLTVVSGQDVCSGVTCQNDGVCQELNGYAQCYCQFGFEGQNCQTAIIDVRKPDISGCPGDIIAVGTENQNVSASWSVPTVWDDSGVYHLEFEYPGGTGVFPPNSQTAVKYTASDPSANENVCEFLVTTVTTCTENLCQNGGTCQQAGSTSPPVCDCEVGFWGQTCEKYIRLNCENGGFCQQDYCTKCMCPDGFIGILCEIEIPTEKINPIMVGCPTGVYVAVDDPNDDSMSVSWDPPTTYDDSGRFDWESTHEPGDEFLRNEMGVSVSYYARDAAQNSLSCCSFRVVVGDGECTTGRVCQNGGKCLHVNGYDRCYCARGYVGVNCEQDNSAIDPVDCRASCPPGYTGRRCEGDDGGAGFQITGKITVVLAGVVAAVSFIL